MTEEDYQKALRRENGKMTVQDMEEFNTKHGKKNFVADGGRVWSLRYIDNNNTNNPFVWGLNRRAS